MPFLLRGRTRPVHRCRLFGSLPAATAAAVLVPVPPPALALLPKEIIDHGPNCEAQLRCLDPVYGVPVEVDAHDERRDLPCKPDDCTRERAELHDGHEYEDLPDGPAQAQGHKEESHVLEHPRKSVDLVEHDEANAREYCFSELYVVHQVFAPPQEREGGKGNEKRQ
jgi:hypothetical protein